MYVGNGLGVVEVGQVMRFEKVIVAEVRGRSGGSRPGFGVGKAVVYVAKDFDRKAALKTLGTLEDHVNVTDPGRLLCSLLQGARTARGLLCNPGAK